MAGSPPATPNDAASKKRVYLTSLMSLAFLAFLTELSALLAVQPLGVRELGALGRPFRLGGGVGFVGGRRVERERGARNEHAEG